MSGCLTAELAAAHAQGTLSPTEREAVLSHLDACDACRELVSQLVDMAPPGTVAPITLVGDLEPPHPRLLPEGTMVGRFVVLERLGVGGMGVVYAAYDPKLKRRVALKLLLEARAEHAHLLEEARALARLSHPSVTAVFEVGETGWGPWLVMELVEGVTFREWRKARKRPVDEVLEVLRQAAAGLGAAHRAGLIHRDFKPSNLLVADHGRAYVTDFGLAGVATAAGTVPYMAPEQLDGHEATERSDQFAFAVTAWEALTGKRPFVATTPRALADAIRQRVWTSELPRRVPGRVRRALVRALAHDPAERFSSMAELGEALMPRRRLRWAAAGVAGLLVAAALVALPAYERRAALARCDEPPPELNRTWNAERRARIERLHPDVAPRLESHATLLRNEFRQACLDVVSGTDDASVHHKRRDCLLVSVSAFSGVVTAYESTTTVLSPVRLAMIGAPSACRAGDVLLRQALPADEALRQTVLELRGVAARLRHLHRLHQWDESLPEVVALDARAREVPFVPLQVETARLLAQWQFSMGARTAAKETALRAARLGLSSGDDELAVESLNMAATIASTQPGAALEADQTRLLALALSQRVGVSDHQRVQTKLRSGLVLNNLGRFDEARSTFLGVLNAQAGSPERMGALTALGRAERELGHLDDSARALEEAVTLVKQRYGDDERALADVRLEYGQTLFALHRPARVELELAVKGGEATNGLEHPRTAEAWLALARLRQAEGDVEGARTLAHRAVMVFERHELTSWVAQARALER